MYDTLFKKLERSQKSGTYKVTGKVAPERKQTVQMKALYAVHNWEDMDSLENRTGLPKRLKSGIENLSGLSMDDVRVHYNSSRPAQFYALAYTQGTDIHVAPGQEKHLAHEAWHVVQQKEGRVHPTMQVEGVPINDSRILEHEADIMGSKAVQCKIADRLIRSRSVNSTCVQRVLPVNELKGMKIVGINQSNDEKEISVKENGDVGEEIITKDWPLFGQGRTAKQKALRAISILAGKIGDVVNNSSMDDSECFYVTIKAKYKARGNWNFLLWNSREPVTIKLKYDFRKKGIRSGQTGGPGYIVKVIKSRKDSQSDAEADMMYGGDNKSDSQYSNKHELVPGSILAATYGEKEQAPIGTNFDAYTKLAGEGARFQCVRENMDRLTDNTVFHIKNELEGVRFCELWKTWSATFHKKYNIQNNEIVSELSKEDSNSGKEKNTLCMGNGKYTTATAFSDDEISL